jgi:hypothetical protein
MPVARRPSSSSRMRKRPGDVERGDLAMAWDARIGPHHATAFGRWTISSTSFSAARIVSKAI